MITDRVSAQTNISLFPEPTFFRSLEDIQQFYNASKTRHVLVGLAFESNGIVSSHDVSYSFILEKDFVPTTQCFPNNAVDTAWLHKTNSSIFIEDGILDLQHILNEIIAEDSGYKPASITTDWQLLPSMATGNASVVLTNVAPTLIAIFQCIAVNSFLTTTAIDIVTERSSRCKEYLYTMGLRPLPYYLAWALTMGVPALIIGAIGFFVHVGVGAFRHAIWHVALLYFLYLCATVSEAYMLAQFVDSPGMAALVTNLFVLIPCQLFPYLATTAVSSGLLSLFAPYAFTFGVFKQVSETFSITDTFFTDILSYGTLEGILFADILLYLAIGWYTSQVRPGLYHTPKPWYFLFTKTYWCPANDHITHNDDGIQQQTSSEETWFEQFHDGKENGVVLQGISKTFHEHGKPPVAAVCGVSASFRTGEITALLGHNGAGKTTLINMLVGLCTPTGGDATIAGHSVVSQMEAVRTSLGVCPQYDILYDLLTATDHMYMVGRIKGMSEEELKVAVPEALAMMGLKKEDYHKKRVKELSGGMRRKLSLAMAFFGDPKVVFLDEPTTGIDTVSRRNIWECLRQQKTGKTIILTTHSMEEADALSDNIFIMANGSFKCGGTPSRLKQQFGVGYYLNIEKTTQQDMTTVLNTAQQFIPECFISNDSESSFSLALPFSGESKIADLLQSVEGCLPSCAGYGLTLTTLEDVFIRVTQQSSVHSSDEQTLDSDVIVNVEKHLNPSDTQRLVHGLHHSSKLKQSYDQFSIVSLLNWLFFKNNIAHAVLFALLFSFIMICFIVPTSVCHFFLSKVNSLSDSCYGFMFQQLFLVHPDKNDNESWLHSFINNNNKTVSIPYTMPSSISKSDVDALVNGINTVSFGTVQPVFFDSEEQLLNETGHQGTHAAGLIIHNISLATRELNVTFLYNWTNQSSPIAIDSLVTSAFYSVFNTSQSPLRFFISTSSLGRHPTTVDTTLLVMIVIASLLGSSLTTTLLATKDVELRSSMFESLLVASGMHPVVMTLSTILWNALDLVIPYSLAAGLFACIPIDGISWQMKFGFFVACIVSVLPQSAFNTFVQNFFSDPRYVVKWLAFIQIVPSFIPLVAVLLILVTGKQDFLTLIDISTKVLQAFSVVLPSSGFCAIIIVLFLFIPTDASLAFIFGYSTSTISSLCWCTTAGFILYTGLSLLTIIHRYTVPNKSKQQPYEPIHRSDDSDVIQARSVAEAVNIPSSPFAAVFQHVRKQYNKRTVAVDDISFAVRRHECFGLLGPNGAGKSTLINMLSGIVGVDSGTIAIGPHPVVGSLATLSKLAPLGRCMQSDGLLSHLTPFVIIMLLTLHHYFHFIVFFYDSSDHLRIILKLRAGGIPQHQQNRIVEETIERIGLGPYTNRQVKALSGGNCRKLSVALATLPGPELIILDEPSTGMDPLTRRTLWNVISEEKRDNSRAILLTTHSMEEADSVCDTVSIVSHGRMKCIGSVQHLKHKYNDGYHLSVRFKDGEIKLDRLKECVHQIVSQSFDFSSVLATGSQTCTTTELSPASLDSFIVEECGPAFTCRIGSVKQLSRVFKFMEECMVCLGIEWYTLSQVSLEDVYLQLVRQDERQEQID